MLSVLAGRGYNLLRNPRTGVEPGDIWMGFDGAFRTTDSSLDMLIDGGFDLPTAQEKRLLDVESGRSDAIAASVGLTVLGPALAAMGAPGVLDEVRSKVQHRHDAFLHISLTDVVECSIPLLEVAQDLRFRQVSSSVETTITGDRPVAVATAVVYSRGFLVDVVDSHGGSLDLGVGIPIVGEVEATVGGASVTTSARSFEGPEPIAIGVRLHKVTFDRKRLSLRLEGVRTEMPVFGEGANIGDVEAAPLLVGGADGDLFTNL